MVSSIALCAAALAPQLTGGATTGFTFIGQAAAQGAPQGLGGGGRGIGSGGTTSGTAGPRGTTNGGSGAVFGGSTAGSGTSSGGTGASAGPGSVNQNRFGGNFTAPTPPPTDPTDPTSSTVPPATAPTAVDPAVIIHEFTGTAGGEAFNPSDRCLAHVAGQSSPTERLSGRNLEFLNAAQVYLAPTFEAGKLKSGLYLLANYQEEMEKREPNAETAGAYLGLVATRPVTEDVVARTNAILCVTSSAKLATEIAATAEQERKVTQQ